VDVSYQHHAPTALPPVPIKWAGWAPELAWMFLEREKSVHPIGNWILHHPAHSLLTTPLVATIWLSHVTNSPVSGWL